MSTKRRVLGLLGVGLLGTALTASMCPGTGGGDCEQNTDCPSEDELCHPTLKQCVANCAKQTDACVDEPTCSPNDIDGVYFKNICVCDPAKTDECPSGEKCSPLDRVCDKECASDDDCSVYPSDQNRTCQTTATGKFCLKPAGTCSPGGCPTGEYCDDSRFGGSNICKTTPSACDTYADCLTADILGVCDPVTGTEFTNLCRDADEVTNTCSGVGVFTGTMADLGPVVYDIEFEADTTLDATCTDLEPTTTHGAVITFFYYDFEGDAYTAQSTASYAALKWARSGGSALSATMPLEFFGMTDTTNATGTEGGVVMIVCFATVPSGIAVQIADSASHKSNIACAP